MNNKDIRLIILSLIILIISLSVPILIINNKLNKNSDSEVYDDKTLYLNSYKKQIYSSSFELINEDEDNNYYVSVSDDIFTFCDDNNDCYAFKYKKELINSDNGSTNSYVPVDDSESVDYYFIAIDSVDSLGENIIQVTKRNADGNYVILYFK